MALRPTTARSVSPFVGLTVVASDHSDEVFSDRL